MKLITKTFDELTTAELYEKLGFVQISEQFLEDGIPHVMMEYRREIIN